MTSRRGLAGRRTPARRTRVHWVSPFSCWTLLTVLSPQLSWSATPRTWRGPWRCHSRTWSLRRSSRAAKYRRSTTNWLQFSRSVDRGDHVTSFESLWRQTKWHNVISLCDIVTWPPLLDHCVMWCHNLPNCVKDKNVFCPQNVQCPNWWLLTSRKHYENDIVELLFISLSVIY